MAISCLGFNTIALFSRQIFKIDDAPVNASLIFWFCFAEMICSVPRNSPMGDYQNIWLTGEHSEPIGTIRTLACGSTQKSPPSVQAVFQVASAPISSRFLCPRPPLLLSAPNQNRHATQAKNSLKRCCYMCDCLHFKLGNIIPLILRSLIEEIHSWSQSFHSILSVFLSSSNWKFVFFEKTHHKLIR